MNLSVKLNAPKYSESAYLDQIFNTRFQNELTPENVLVLIEDIKKEEEKKNKAKFKDLTPEDMQEMQPGSPGSPLDLAFKIQTKANEVINERAENLRATIHDEFLLTHASNVVSFEVHIKRQHYLDYIYESIQENLFPKSSKDEALLALKAKFAQALTNEFEARMLMKDDDTELPIKDITEVQAILLEDGRTVRVKYTNKTKIYQKMLADILLERADLLEQIVKLFINSGSIVRSQVKDEHNQKVELKAIHHMIKRIFSQPIKYREMDLERFIYRLASDTVSSFYWPLMYKKELRLEDLRDDLIINQFMPEVINKDIWKKINMKI